VVLHGTVPVDAEPAPLVLAVEEPAEHAAALFARLLEARGIRHYGRVRVRCAPEAPPPAVPQVLAEHRSPPMTELAALVNKISQNLHAELLLRAAARERGGDGSMAEANRLRQEWLEGIGVRADDAQLRDGSGLARHGLLTPEVTVALLAWVAQQDWAEAYIAGLPVAGVDGTLSNRMRDTAAAGRVFAKTGTLSNSNALSGFATTVPGRRLVFSMFGNLHALSGRDATGVLDALCVAMVEEIGARRR
jgi:serine-type D-Ala-D-Ala carboxypeptidase/endopeptidase (penicillin-binding protein 4)